MLNNSGMGIVVWWIIGDIFMNYKKIKNIVTIDRPGGRTLELNIIKWFDRPESYDLRLWDGDTPLKGVSFSEDEWIEILEADERYDYEEYDEEDDDQDEVDDDIIEEELDYKDFFIHSDEQYCNHRCRPIIAMVHQYYRGNVRLISFNANYCPICGVYYITENTFYRITREGRVLCQLLSREEYKEYKKQEEYGELKPQSVLNMIGYNVNAKSDLSEDTRRTVLKYAIDEGVVTKKRVISYLEYFIRLNRNVRNNKNAVEKWADDLDWVQRYSSNGKRIVGVRKMIRENNFDAFMAIPEGIENDLPFK